MAEKNELLKELRIERDSRPGGAGRWLWALVLVPLALAAGGGWWWWETTRAAVVRTAAVEEIRGAAGGAVLNASGYVTARRQATVSAKVTGKIVEVLIEEGMRVKEGQVVARLDDATPQVNLALSKAQLAAARQALAETRVRLAEAKLTLQRTQGLAAEGVSSQAELDKAQAEVDSLEARLALGQEEAAVAERQVAVRQRELDDTIIRAPFAGVVVSKDAQPGEMVSPISAGGGFTRTGICTIVDMGSLEIEVDVNESYIARVKPAQRVEAVLDAYPDWRVPAHVITTIPSADRQKATVKVRIGFERLDPRLLPDMGVKVSFLDPEWQATSALRPRLVVPRAAVRREGEEDVVYVVREGRVERRPVRLGAADGNRVDVLAGLAAGEPVVVEGPEKLADGNRVTVR